MLNRSKADIRRAVRGLAIGSTTLIIGGLLSANAAAQAGKVWNPVRSSAPAGTPAKVIFDEIASDTSNSYFDVFIEGFWSEKVKAPDGLTYDRIEVPGLQHYGQVGAPDLPVVRMPLAVPTSAPDVFLLSATSLSQASFSGLLIYPLPGAALDEVYDPTGDPGPGDTKGKPEEFKKDKAIYGSPGPWPTSDGPTPLFKETMMSSIPAVTFEVYPAKFFPTSQVLRINHHVRYHFFHPGSPMSHPLMTKDRFRLASQTFLNWPAVQGWLQADTNTYSSRYLIVTPSAYLPTLDEFITHKKASGFSVTTITTESTGSICGNIRGAIDTWYQLGSPEMDHYCLLVGDTSVIPLCPSPTIDVKYSDDRYGSPGGTGDLDEEVYVGRLSVDDATDLAYQLDKIIDYEVHPTKKGDYDEVLLVAHKEDAPEKYEGAHEVVANAAYAETPTFIKVYGSQFGANNAKVIQEIDDQVGVVAYRGHGSTNTWSDWNVSGQNFHKNEVLSLSNQALLPVVWAFNCTNSNVNAGGTVDCIGETWLEAENRGAVAHYGSTTTSGTSQNHVLDRAMFEAVYDHGLKIHSHAIAHAESTMADEVSGLNSWMYMLLGDPSMKIRTEPPQELHITAPDAIPTCTGPNCITTIVVKDSSGAPLPGVLVSLYKRSSAKPADEILANAYTGTGGTAAIPGGPTSLGWIDYSARDDHGNVAKGTIGTISGPWTTFGDAKQGINGQPLLTGTGTLLPKQPATLDLVDAAPHAKAFLLISLFDNPTPLLGGILHPLPLSIDPPLTFQTAVDGSVAFPIPAWPAVIPPGTHLYFQYVIDDDFASFGYSFSNMLRAIVP